MYAPAFGRVFFERIRVKFFLVMLLAASPPAFAAPTKVFPVLGVTAAATNDGRPHLGPDFSVLVGSCQDSCSGIGPTVGVADFRTHEYFAGVAFGAAYFGSVWADYAARIRDGEVTGHHVTLAVGFGLMMMGGLYLDRGDIVPHFEFGLTGKIPLGLD